jgi:hypothetical protein
LSSEAFFEITANSFMVLNERERIKLKSKKQLTHQSYYGENSTPKLYPEFNRKIEELKIEFSNIHPLSSKFKFSILGKLKKCLGCGGFPLQAELFCYTCFQTNFIKKKDLTEHEEYIFKKKGIQSFVNSEIC